MPYIICMGRLLNFKEGHTAPQRRFELDYRWFLSSYSLCSPGWLGEWQYNIWNVISRYDVSPTSEVKEIFSDIPFHKNSISFWVPSVWYISALFICSVCPLRTYLQLCMEDSEADFADYFVISRGNQKFRPLKRGKWRVFAMLR
jgi:hypothetical protein